MPRMVALKSWTNWDHEGPVDVGDEFDASDTRAAELRRAGLAVPSVGERARISVIADPPADGTPPAPRLGPARRALLQSATGPDFLRLLDLTEARHRRYAARWSADYVVRREARAPKGKYARPAHWRKVDLIAEALIGGAEHVLWLDADCIIVDGACDLFAACTWGIGICECWDSPTIPRHLNTGVLWFSRSAEVLAFVDAWNGMPNKPGEDQTAFIALMEERRWRSLLSIVPNRYNMVEEHMQAVDPVVRSYHGDKNRLARMQALLARGEDAAA